MKIRATSILRTIPDEGYHAWLETVYNSYISGRFEIQWSDDEPWLNLGVQIYGEFEWLTLVSICMLGARKADIEFIYIDLIPTNLLPTKEKEIQGCDDV